jgi:hypothetical protein
MKNDLIAKISPQRKLEVFKIVVEVEPTVLRRAQDKGFLLSNNTLTPAFRRAGPLQSHLPPSFRWRLSSLNLLLFPVMPRIMNSFVVK